METTGEYLGCMAGNVPIGIPVSHVQEVFQSKSITRVPGCPDFIAGMVNVRGTIVPVLDPWRQRSKEQLAKIVILATTQGVVGLLVRDIVDLIRFKSRMPVKVLPETLKKLSDFFSETGMADMEFYLMKVDELVANTLQTQTDAGTSL